MELEEATEAKSAWGAPKFRRGDDLCVAEVMREVVEKPGEEAVAAAAEGGRERSPARLQAARKRVRISDEPWRKKLLAISGAQQEIGQGLEKTTFVIKSAPKSWDSAETATAWATGRGFNDIEGMRRKSERSWSFQAVCQHGQEELKFGSGIVVVVSSTWE